MPLKKLLLRYQPVQLYVILVLSICYFSVQLVLSHITHALTLLMASYHMLCNIFALGGYLVTIKNSEIPSCLQESTDNGDNESNSNGTLPTTLDVKPLDPITKKSEQKLSKCDRREIKLRNTFGWTRIDILTMLIVCIILASLSFSLLVEALQTIIHIDHQDAMHLPIPVMTLGFVGLILNGLTYLLIGGYTIHQGTFLQLAPNGEVILEHVNRKENSNNFPLNSESENQEFQIQNIGIKNDNKEMQLEPSEPTYHPSVRRQSAVEILRDASSAIFVIVCALIVYMAEDEEHTAKFIDPILSIFSCTLLMSLSYPYMKESCLILLQTIPGTIDMEIFEHTLMTKFPGIVNYHDLHIWQLSAHKSVATVHIQFCCPKIYLKIIDDVRLYFHEQGVTEVTIQPEFYRTTVVPSLECLMPCNSIECAEKVCCKDSRTELHKVSINLN